MRFRWLSKGQCLTAPQATGGATAAASLSSQATGGATAAGSLSSQAAGGATAASLSSCQGEDAEVFGQVAVATLEALLLLLVSLLACC